MSTTDQEPFGDCLYEGITDWDGHRRATVQLCITGLDTARHRAAARALRMNDYRGGFTRWDPKHEAEAA
ncbi:hypothetical protein IWX75_002915 [Arthrobacter sp. CAN_A6]|uniref:hypothetical protein n=1 Tax=Arthrobacter sp. CAN_A6 TaxID=2787721 RepID=UPI0018CAFC64